jgi:hypothetical protein
MKTTHDFSIRVCFLDAQSPAARLEYSSEAWNWAEAEVLRRGYDLGCGRSSNPWGFDS